MAGDTARLLEALDLNDVTHVGFRMGGVEVARYMGKYNQAASSSHASTQKS